MDPQEFWSHNSSASAPAPAEPVEEQVEPVAAVEPDHSNEQPEQVDYEARAKELEERIRQAEEQNKQYTSTLSEINLWAQQQRAQQERADAEARFRKQWEDSVEASRGMGREDAEQFLSARMAHLVQERDAAFQQQMRQMESQWDARLRAVAKPEFIRHLAKDNELDDSEVQFLLSLDNPDEAAKLAPYLKGQKQRYRELQNQIEQLSRTQQAGQLQSTGIGRVGGTVAPVGNVQLPDDPDEAALMILHQINRG